MRFKKIYIEITNTCNLSCSFCVQNQRPPRRMSVDELRHILKQIKPFTNYVYLHVLGEPLSHPDLETILDLCEEYGMNVNMTSNGTLFKQKEDVLLRGKIRQLNVSLHSFPQHYQQAYLEHVISICDKLAEKHTYISYRLWSMRQGELDHETMQIVDYLKQAYHCDIPVIEKGAIRLKEHTYLHFEEVFAWPDLSSFHVSTKGSCLGMKQMCAILSDGTITPCCLDSKGDIALGNIFEESFSSIIEKERAQAIKTGFQNKVVVEELCQKCSYRTRFDEKR
ncbi:radical SAM/SPASM domain-containing protein [[Eubacterium] hominis]|uniref:radical SAM/SPASM domain-containing protein n=1 Tax=[Eubacterium] hominis TaxID=2764325 RepID=UPI003A4D735F